MADIIGIKIDIKRRGADCKIYMEAFLRRLRTIPEIRELINRIDEGGCPAAMTGLQPVQRACIGAAIALDAGRPVIFICGGEREARQLAADVRNLTGENPVYLPSREWRLHPGATGSREWEQARIAAFRRMPENNNNRDSNNSKNSNNSGDKNNKNLIIITTPDALIARTMPKELLSALCTRLETGGKADMDVLTRRLIISGYSRCEEVEGVGQFARRGGILDIYAPGQDQPVRLEFFDDEIDSMGFFDPGTQRRIKNIDFMEILPASEILPYCAGLDLTGKKKENIINNNIDININNKLPEILEKLAGRNAKKREKLAERLKQDAENLRGGLEPGGMDRYLAAIYPGESSGMDYMPEDSILFLCESGRVEERIEASISRTRQDVEILLESGQMAGEYAKLQLNLDEFREKLQDFPVIMMDSLPTSRYLIKPRGLLSLNARQLSSYGGSLEMAAADLAQYRESGVAALVLCSSETRCMNLYNLLEERGIPAALGKNNGEDMPPPGEIRIIKGALSAGCEWPYLKLAVLTEGQFLENRDKNKDFNNKNKRAATNRKKLKSYADLSPGDLVVHTRHGIGRFIGMERMPVDGVMKDYIKISYAGGDLLYVPATQLDQVGKYIGTGGEESGAAKLNKLGGADWTRQKNRAKKAVKDLAKGLTRLYAERQRRPGYAFSADSIWQREFEDAFPYEETEDQLRAIAEIKQDMETPRPMDRLLCGDVGYGKTEVALRAVMKCILDGKQAAILAPTTVLAQQHYATAMGRFQSFPVKLEVLSRFTPPKEAKRILNETAAGHVDLLIGTHKLLQKNVIFKNLGLVVIDEEQRFGVTHKERLKEISRQVDVLTLSATPIPRTLNMALSGLRDMSSIDEPPAGRQPVQTYVMEHDWNIIADALRRELDRGGQAYYIHNRIVMRLMMDGEADILVCTTIIETGIDIPNVNTLVIENADYMGLAQLHQIRGRIGRSARRAYAYLTYRAGKILQETAEKRLSAIRQYVEFGSGFKIAMRDLEIRGAGNLLGPEQSGYLMSVGYDLYLKLLEEAVLEERGEEKEIECAADLTVNANIPEDYIASSEHRMDIYRRIAAVRSGDDASDLLDELIDRYGEPPKPVLALLDIALLRADAARTGISDITQKNGAIWFTLAAFNPEILVKLSAMGKYHRKLTVSGGDTPILILKLANNTDPLDAARELVDDLARAGDLNNNKK